MGSTPCAPAPTPSLQERIQTLTEVHNRLQTLRHAPTMLLRPPSTSGLPDFAPPFDPTIDTTFQSTPSHDFGALKDFLGELTSDKVQEALQAARASEDADQSELGLCFLRESRKRKRPQSPVGSPQPYVPSPPRSSSLFASGEEEPAAMRAESLVEYVREFNRGHAGEGKLAVWSRTTAARDEVKKGGLSSPVVLRFTIEDVLTAYISLIFAKKEEPLVVESVTAFGPRERKLPHEQSDYLAFQGLSEHLARMLVSRPRVPLQTLMHVLVSYRGLFVERCRVCQRVLSTEGHVPAVGRVWTGADGWEVRHAGCMYG